MAWENVIDAVAERSRRRRKTRVKSVDFIVVHHSVTPPKFGWKEILNIHLKEKYASIGYHFVIRGSDGQVYKCLPVDPAVAGAHARSQNAVSIGVCVTGSYEASPPNNDALYALYGVLSELHKLYPKARILGHRDMKFSKTACPGKYLYSALQRILKEQGWKG